LLGEIEIGARWYLNGGMRRRRRNPRLQNIGKRKKARMDAKAILKIWWKRRFSEKPFQHIWQRKTGYRASGWPAAKMA